MSVTAFSRGFRYCGEYYDKETATVYLRARNYNPSTGRFISRDSYAGRKSDPLSLNLYTYCRNNPIIFVDPSGHSYAVLPNGKRMSINSASDVKQLNLARDRLSVKIPMTSSSQVKTTTAPTSEATPITGGLAKPTSTTTYTTIQTEEQFYASQKKNTNIFSKIFGVEYICSYKEEIENNSFTFGPWKCECSESLKTQLARSGDSSKLISIYFNQNADNIFKSSIGINVNLSKFTYNYNVGIGKFSYNYMYQESDNSSWQLGYGLNGFEGYVGIGNTIQNEDGISGSTDFTGSFNGMSLLIAIIYGNVSTFSSTPNFQPS